MSQKRFHLYFGESLKKAKKIGIFDTEKEYWQKIDDFLKEKKFKSYYYRQWKMDSEMDITVLDFGSHYEFFYIAKKEDDE
jgi:hypothetical protein